MSMTTIKDGTGIGNLAKVTDKNRISTLSVNETISATHALKGDAYNYNTGTLTLTSDSKSALAYIKNNEDEDLVVTAPIYLLGNTTDGASTADHLVQIERNPTGGTIVSDATEQAPVNRDFSSARTLVVDSYKGGDGTNTWIKYDIDFDFPLVLDSRTKDTLDMILSDDLSGLLYHRVLIRGYTETLI